MEQRAPGQCCDPAILVECAYGCTDRAELLSDLPAEMELLPLPHEAAFLTGKAFAGCRRLGEKQEQILGDLHVGAHTQVAGPTFYVVDP